MTRTLIFDCDGVLADTERYGHLPAFNQTFAEFGLATRWSEEEYAEKLLIGGGKERMATLLSPEFTERAGLGGDLEGQQALLRTWHRRKTEIYLARIATGLIPGRPGISRIVGSALDAGWALAVASTSAEPSVRGVLDHVVGAAQAARFSLVLAGDVVAHKKPAPDIYLLALERLGADESTTLVIEDSRNGLVAAAGAGLPCLITINDYTVDQDFHEAALVVSSLGDIGGEVTSVIANRTPRQPREWVTLDDLESCMAQ